MTTGAWDNSLNGGWFNRVHFKTWNGTDRPKIEKSIRQPPVVVVRGGKTYRYHFKPARKPRRVIDVDHEYHLVTRYQYSDHIQRLNNPYGDWNAGFASLYVSDTVFSNTGLDFTTVGFDANDQIRLVGKLREKIFGSDFNASVFLGEGHQTLALVTDSATRIYHSVRALKRGKLKTAAEILVNGTGRKVKKHVDFPVPEKKKLDAVLSSKWLELQYGWLPLIKDAHGAAEALAHHLSVPFRQRVTASIFRGNSEIKFKGSTAGVGNDTYNYELKNISKRRIIVTLTEQPSLAAQLGLLNPENAAWELMPWSFVIDWFIPIGSYLDARAISKLAFDGCVTSTKVTSTLNNCHDTGAFPGSGLPWANCGFLPKANFESYNDRLVQFDRVLSGMPEVPLPKFKGFAKAASWQHCVNAVALLVTLKAKA